jgi:PAS domain S-box-containing protein
MPSRRDSDNGLIKVKAHGGAAAEAVAVERAEIRNRDSAQILRKNAILKGINRILEAALDCDTEEAVGRVCLEVAQQITGSEHGFIGESTPNGLLLDITTGETGSFALAGIVRSVLAEGRSLLTNCPSDEPEDDGLPAAPPGCTTFLCAPLVLGGQTLGVVAVANRREGYSEDELESLEALAPAIVEALYRKRTETAIRENQAQNELLARTLELSSQPFNIAYPDGRLGLVNRAFELLTGYSAEELKSISWKTLTPPEWAEVEKKKLEDLNRSGEPVRYDKEYIRKDRTRVPIELLVHVAKDAGGKPLYYYSFINDITERKRTERAIIRSEKLASLGRMAATIAHEINNPLAAVTNALFLAQNSLDDKFSLRLYLEMADEELRRVAHITRQALGFYRESSAPTETALSELVDSVLDLLKGRIATSGASIECQYETDVKLKCVGGEIRQVVSNLVSNSLDAIGELGEQGVIKLRVSSTRSVNSGRRSVRVTVMDNGRGLNRAAQSHIFEPFFTTKESRGTGLGLWVCKQLVDKHGGSIKLRSYTDGPRRGTSFSIKLPAGND